MPAMGSTISTAHRVQFCRALHLTPFDAKMGVRILGGANGGREFSEFKEFRKSLTSLNSLTSLTSLTSLISLTSQTTLNTLNSLPPPFSPERRRYSPFFTFHTFTGACYRVNV